MTLSVRSITKAIFLSAFFVGCADTEPSQGGSAEDGAASSQPTPKNTLTDEERAAGWMLLFDGTSTEGWHGYNLEAFPDVGWQVDDGDLIVFASDGSLEGSGGNIVSDATFSDFELVFDFLVSPVGNSGVFYRVVEAAELDLWMVAPEFQVLDDTAYFAVDGADGDTHRTGDNYDLHASAIDASNPVGEWNRARILVDGPHIEHWLNGRMTVSYEMWSPEWQELVAVSKFAPYEEYGRPTEGSIAIQDHGREIRYKNIKIRPLGDH